MKTTEAKQYLLLDEKTVIEHTLSRLSVVPVIEKIVIGVAKNDAVWQTLHCQYETLMICVEAGPQRVETVENCLRAIVDKGGENDWALVHDAARPCVRPDEVQRLIDQVLVADTGGILAVPISDTLKRGSDDQQAKIVETVPRDQLWRAMTPQMFRVGELLAAIEHAAKHRFHITDEASAMELTGFQPLLIPCSPDNIKITFPDDIQFAEMILRAQAQTKK